MSDGSVFARPVLSRDSGFLRRDVGKKASKEDRKKERAERWNTYQDMAGGFSIDDYHSMNGDSTNAGAILLDGGSLQFDFVPDPSRVQTSENEVALVPENDWSAVDARAMGLTAQQALELKQGGQIESAFGTDTSSGKRERTAAEVVKGFGNNFDSMESSGLAAALRGAQESIIQKRMDGGAKFGYVDTATQANVTSNPSNPQDGASPVADIEDQSRTLEIPNKDPQMFLQEALKNVPKSMRGDDASEKVIAEFFRARTEKDVFDEATQQWKKVPINK